MFLLTAVPELSAGVPKPYGPLIANNIHLNSLQLSWNKGIERQKNITYLVEYVHFWHDKTEPWSKLGTTTGSDFIVRDLEEDTMYKFRVKSLRGGLESQPLYSRRIRTKSSGNYRKNPKILDTQKFAVITLKVQQDGFSLE